MAIWVNENTRLLCQGITGGAGSFHCKQMMEYGTNLVAGVTPGKGVFSDVELQERLTLQMINEAALCLQEGILRSPRDGDVGAIFGLGFPPYTGGPFTYCDAIGVDTVVSKLRAHADRYGARFAPAQVLVDYANAGKRFRS